MKIAFLSQHFSNGGAERSISVLSEHLPNDIESLLIVFEGSTGYRFNGRVVNLDVPHTALGVMARFCSFWVRFWRLRNLLKLENPDVVVSFLGEPNILNALTARNAVFSFHNPIAGLHTGPSGLLLRTLLPVLGRCGISIAVSKGLREELVSNYHFPPERTVALPNPLAVDVSQSNGTGLKTNPFDDGRPFILVLGRLSPEKAPACALRAFAALNRVESYGLVFIGQGPLMANLLDLTRALGLESAVRFLGWQEDPFPFLRAASALLNPSRFEGFGYAIAEAMACGIPVVATDAPFGPREILLGSSDPDGDTPCGILVPPCPCGDCIATTATTAEIAFASAINRVLNDPAAAMRRADKARSRVLDFSGPAVTKRYLDILRKAAAR